jgi:hypothetical protein
VAELRAKFEGAVAEFLAENHFWNFSDLPSNDLLRKLHITALYIFAGWTPDQLGEKYHAASITVYTWLKECTHMLDLPMKSKGRPTKKFSDRAPKK